MDLVEHNPNREYIDSKRQCTVCGYIGEDFYREYYPDGGFAPLTVCPDCGCGV